MEETLRSGLAPAELARIFQKKRAKLGRGIDRLDVDAFERRLSIELGHASRKALQGTLRFSPYLEMLVSKGRNKAPRVIARPTIRDNLILSALKDALHHELPDDVPRKLPNQVIRDLLTRMKASPGVELMRLDIRAFYDSIPHAKLAPMVRRRVGNGFVFRLIESAISGSIVPAGYRKADLKKYAVERGVPQGLPISNFLAHIYLSNFDAKNKLRLTAYFRYVDDILVLTSSSNAIAVERSLAKSLAGLGLRINRDKTKRFKYSEQFDYLGYEIANGEARPRRVSVEKFIRSIAGMFANLRRGKFSGRETESWSPEDMGWVFVEELNERITGAISSNKQYGWVFYFNEATDLSVFSRIDHIVRKMAYRAEHLTNEMRRSIKRTVRAYHESKYNKVGGYILNYDANSTIEDKRSFLVRLRYLGCEAAARMDDSLVEKLYFSRVSARLVRLERDVGLIS